MEDLFSRALLPIVVAVVLIVYVWRSSARYRAEMEASTRMWQTLLSEIRADTARWNEERRQHQEANAARLEALRLELAATADSGDLDDELDAPAPSPGRPTA